MLGGAVDLLKRGKRTSLGAVKTRLDLGAAAAPLLGPTAASRLFATGVFNVARPTGKRKGGVPHAARLGIRLKDLNADQRGGETL